MFTSTLSLVSAILASYDFSPTNHQIVGNGHNLLINEILKANPRRKSTIAKGIFSSGVTALKHQLKAKDIAEFSKYDKNTLSEPIPIGGEAYIIKNIIYNCNRDRALSILKNCHQAMADRGKLLLLETVIPTSNAKNSQTTPSQWLDLTLFLMTGGRDRRETKYRELLAAAGFKLTKVVYTQQSFINAIEAVKV